MTNTERQRLFRERHPGYYAQRKAAERAALKRCTDQYSAAFLDRLRAQAKAADARAAAESVAIECGMI